MNLLRGKMMDIFNAFQKLTRPAPSDNRCVVYFNDDGVACRRPDGKQESVSWADLRSVVIRTTSEGPFVDDVFWVLVGQNGECVVPSESAGIQELMERLGQLPRFDHNACISAMSCTSDKESLCWVCEEERKML
jgi:hypothetical protein